ncbi:MAG: glycolate oxidase iron-sulfur subunit [Betaproteobacteria bacterium]
MRTRIEPTFRQTAAGDEAEAIMRRCVHCGLCNAVCPTYQLLGDERDGPRGRIDLIMQVFEGHPWTEATREHLDRCLHCAACETACPSGVGYTRLLDIGRAVLARRPRPLADRLRRAALSRLLPRRRLFGWALGLARWSGPLAPKLLGVRVPPRARLRSPPGTELAPFEAEPVLMPSGCVEPVLAPGIRIALARVLAVLGMRVEEVDIGCCGALSHHLDDFHASRRAARRTIDALSAALDRHGARSVAVTGSGCTAFMSRYASLLADDPDYAGKAARVAQATRDPAELISPYREHLRAATADGAAARLVYQAPCTQQHARRLRGLVEPLLEAVGHTLLPAAEAHLCCGAGGAYSLLQPTIAGALRARKLGHLCAETPDGIASANIACITHLSDPQAPPVRHWLEWLAPRLRGGA